MILKYTFVPFNVYEMILSVIAFFVKDYVYMSLLIFYILLSAYYDVTVSLDKINKINSISIHENKVKVIRKINN